MLLKDVSRLSELPSDRLTFDSSLGFFLSPLPTWGSLHSCLICERFLWQKLSLWLSQPGFEGVLAEGTF